MTAKTAPVSGFKNNAIITPTKLRLLKWPNKRQSLNSEQEYFLSPSLHYLIVLHNRMNYQKLRDKRRKRVGFKSVGPFEKLFPINLICKQS